MTYPDDNSAVPASRHQKVSPHHETVDDHVVPSQDLALHVLLPFPPPHDDLHTAAVRGDHEVLLGVDDDGGPARQGVVDHDGAGGGKVGSHDVIVPGSEDCLTWAER